MKKLFCCLTSLTILAFPMTAQLVPAPIDRFERVRWGMPIAQLRAMSSEVPLEIMRSVKTRKIVESNHHIFLTRQEVAFGETLRVSYAIHTSDSTLRHIMINIVEFAMFSDQAHGRHDSVWKRIGRRYGSLKASQESAGAHQIWETPTSRFEAFHVEGPASAVTFIARPRKADD